MGQDVMSWPILYFNDMDNIDDPHELTNIIKLWFDEFNTSKFWDIRIENYENFDAIKMQHVYPSIRQHDNALLSFHITIPHDISAFKSFTLKFKDDEYIPCGPSDPNFFKCLHRVVSEAIITMMKDMNVLLNRGLEYKGVTLCKEL